MAEMGLFFYRMRAIHRMSMKCIRNGFYTLTTMRNVHGIFKICYILGHNKYREFTPLTYITPIHTKLNDYEKKEEKNSSSAIECFRVFK